MLEKLQTYSLYIAAFSMPFKHIPVIFAAIFLALTIYKCIIGGCQKPKHPYFLVLVALFILITPVSLLYTANVDRGITFIENKAFFLLIPAFAFGLKTIDLKRLSKFYISGVFLATIVCIGYAFYRSLNFIDGELVFKAAALDDNYSFIEAFFDGRNYFFYFFLSFFIHPTYFSFYIQFAIVLIYWLIVNKYLSKKHVFYSILLVVYFSIFIWMLSSRSGIIAHIILLGSVVVFYIMLMKKLLLKIAFSIILLSIIAFLFTNPRFANVKFNNIETTNIRILLWKSSLKVVKNNFWIGVGSGSTRDALKKKYADIKLQIAIDKELNAHNQYIEELVEHGISGFSILILILIYILAIGMYNKNYIILSLLFIISFNFLFESVLNKNIGCLFVSYWFGILLYLYPTKTELPLINHSNRK